MTYAKLNPNGTLTSAPRSLRIGGALVVTDEQVAAILAAAEGGAAE